MSHDRQLFTLFNKTMPEDLLDKLKNDWLFTMANESPYNKVFDVFYLIKMDGVLDYDKDARYPVFESLIKEIELDGQDSERYGETGSSSRNTGVLSDQIDI